MAKVTIGPGGDLKAALDGAQDVEITFTGTHRNVGKVRNLRGVTLVGGDESAVIGSSGVQDVANLRIEDSSAVTLLHFTLRDATMNQARALQVFRTTNLVAEDLTTGPNVRADHVHLVSVKDATIRRLRGDGTGGEWLRPGVAGHIVYCAEGCERVTVEDVESVLSLGAPLQCNGESGPVRSITFRRCRCRDWQNGFGVNLPRVSGVVIEDLTLSSTAREANGGVWTDGSGVSVARYAFTLPSGKPEFTGSIQKTPGAPAPPSFDAAPVEPPITQPPPGTDTAELEARIAELEAEQAAAVAWYAAAPAWLRG